MRKISVCIATYNGAKYIGDQLRTISEQLREIDEIIISDDGSTDGTVDIVKGLNDDRIKIYTDQKFRNPIYNFENAIKKASGDIIFLSDQDDVWLPGKVDKMMTSLEKHDLVVSNCFIGDDDLNIIRNSYFEWRNSKTGLLVNLWRNSYLGCCMAFDRKILEKILPFPSNIPMHDMWIGVVAEWYYSPCFLDEKLMIYRRHYNNATKLDSNFSSTSSGLQKFKYRLNLIRALLTRVLGIK